ncbi:MAG: cell division protein SepF [Actinomycetaceae bacterium]|nr:cell division protein SepF [Actinomycetaceae bacterium]
MLQRLTECIALSDNFDEENEDIYDEEFFEEDDLDSVGEITSLRSVKDSEDGGSLARIVTVWPKSFDADIQDFADPFREGVPVILNLAYTEETARGRIVDFASGICYGLQGSLNKISPDVFLMTPHSVKMQDSRSERDRF